MAATVKGILIEELKALLAKDPATLVHDRIEKFSAMGVWNEEV
jgi:acetyl-CoA carboxylase carboxyl transferase subunit alpha